MSWLANKSGGFSVRTRHGRCLRQQKWAVQRAHLSARVVTRRQKWGGSARALVCVCCIWWETKWAWFIYMDWENLGPSSFWWRHGRGDTPYPPMTSYYVTSRALIRTVFKWRSPWGDSHQDLSWSKGVEEGERSQVKEDWKVSWSLDLKVMTP